MGRRFGSAGELIQNFPKRQSGRLKGWLIMLVLGCCWIAITGCNLLSLLSQSEPATDTLSEGLQDQQDSLTPAAAETNLEEAEQPTVLAETAETQSEPQSEQSDTPGKFILAVTNSGIWGVNELTHEARQISTAALNAPWDLNEGMSPDKRFFAYITGFEGSSAYPMLVVLDIEDQSVRIEMDLSGPILQPGPDVMNSPVGDPSFEAFRAMELQGSIAWSPDGTRIAFVGAGEGDSADVYLLDPVAQTVTRLTDEAGHAFGLHWSPDGQLLAYLSANSFGTGAGAEMEGLWVYEVANNRYQRLGNLESSGEKFLGWTDNSHFLIASWNAMCENHNLRLANAVTLSDEPIISGCFTGAAYDPERNQGLFAVTEFNYENCACGEPLDPGLMVFGAGVGYPIAGEVGYKKFELLDAYTVSFIPEGNQFLIYGGDGQQFIFNDQLYNMEIPAEVYLKTPYVSPNGGYWAWSSRSQNGLWVTTDRNMNPVELSSLFSGVPLWSSDAESLYFYEYNRLFSASAPLFDTGTLVVEIAGAEILGLVK